MMTPEEEDDLHTDLKNCFWGFTGPERVRLADYALPIALDRTSVLEARIEKQRAIIQRLLHSLREARKTTDVMRVVDVEHKPVTLPDLPIEDLPPYFEELSGLWAQGEVD